SKVPSQQRSTLERDLERLEELNFAHAAEQKTLDLMRLSDLNGASSLEWLNQRVSYILEDGDTSSLSLRALPFSNYPNNGETVIENASPRPSTRGGSQGGVTVMSNIGTALYFSGKTSDKLLTLNVKTGF